MQERTLQRRPGSTESGTSRLPSPTRCGSSCSCSSCGARREQGAIAPPEVEEVVRGSGQQLDPSTAMLLQSTLGHDFSHVRVHTDASAAASADSVGALAYTVGSHVVFGAGLYAPETAGGIDLLLHEMHHVVQQRGLPDVPSVVAALSELDAELFVVVEQDMYPVDFDVPAPVATRTRDYLRGVGVGG